MRKIQENNKLDYPLFDYQVVNNFQRIINEKEVNNSIYLCIYLIIF